MATLANLVVRISGNTVALNKALGSAERRTGTFSNKAGGSLKLFGTAAKLGIGVAVTALAGLVTSFGLTLKGIVDVEKELRPMIERSRFGAESLQVLSETATRAGSEDGLEGIVDTAQELQLQLGEIALAGKSRALPALKSLGLTAAKLQQMEPEEAWRLVVEQIQQIPNVANRAIAAEEIFGGTSEKLAGIINLTTGEFAALESEVRNTSDLWSGETLAVSKGVRPRA